MWEWDVWGGSLCCVHKNALQAFEGGLFSSCFFFQCLVNFKYATHCFVFVSEKLMFNVVGCICITWERWAFCLVLGAQEKVVQVVHQWTFRLEAWSVCSNMKVENILIHLFTATTPHLEDPISLFVSLELKLWEYYELQRDRTASWNWKDSWELLMSHLAFSF